MPIGDLGPVVVTGGSGFIGSHLVRRLVRDGVRVHLLARSQHSLWRIPDIRPAITVWYCDITDRESIASCIQDIRPAVIFHLAGTTEARSSAMPLESLEKSLATNLHGTLNVASAAAALGSSLKRLVRMGGLAEYGAGPAPFDEDQRETPISPYGFSQVAATHACQLLHRSTGAPIITIRPALIYGPAQSENFMIPSLIRHCLEGHSCSLHNPHSGRDFLHIEDLVDAIIRAAEVPAAAGEIINVGSGVQIRIRDVAQLIVRLTESRIELGESQSVVAPACVKHQVCSRAKAKRLLDWVPRISLEDGLARTITWWRKQLAGEEPKTIAPEN